MGDHYRSPICFSPIRKTPLFQLRGLGLSVYFSHCKVIYKHAEFDEWVYYPQPEAKLQQFRNPSLFDAIAVPITGIQYGAKWR
ncbi:MAG TPA: hypothetical protein VJ821_18085 [Anaerolineales bacterium]|nr:hypothetical protein [Anaerolineales bacterium]